MILEKKKQKNNHHRLKRKWYYGNCIGFYVFFFVFFLWTVSIVQSRVALRRRYASSAFKKVGSPCERFVNSMDRCNLFEFRIWILLLIYASQWTYAYGTKDKCYNNVFKKEKKKHENIGFVFGFVLCFSSGFAEKWFCRYCRKTPRSTRAKIRVNILLKCVVTIKNMHFALLYYHRFAMIRNRFLPYKLGVERTGGAIPEDTI